MCHFHNSAINTLCTHAGEDYIATEELMVIFQPEDMRIPLSITLLDDSIPEPPEDFRLVLSRQVNTPDVIIGQDNTIVRLEDADSKYIHSHINFMLQFLFCAAKKISGKKIKIHTRGTQRQMASYVYT